METSHARWLARIYGYPDEELVTIPKDLPPFPATSKATAAGESTLTAAERHLVRIETAIKKLNSLYYALGCLNGDLPLGAKDGIVYVYDLALDVEGILRTLHAAGRRKLFQEPPGSE